MFLNTCVCVACGFLCDVVWLVRLRLFVCFVGLICVCRLCFWCYVVWFVCWVFFAGVCCMSLMCLCVPFVNYCVTVYALC